MSYSGLLKHKVEVKELEEFVVDGASTYEWVIKIPELRCFVDLELLSSVDPYFTPAGGRPTERGGKLFVKPLVDGSCPVKAGDTFRVTQGPAGTFKIQNQIDEIWTPHRLHHYELGILEVAPQIARKQVSQ